MCEEIFIVFIVDDDEDDIEALSEAFKALSQTSLIKSFRSSGQLLLELKILRETELPNIIILDHYLALLYGTDLIEIIRSERSYDSITLAVYSSSIQPEKALSMLRKGADVCIEKGHTILQMTDHVDAFCKVVQMKQTFNSP